MRGLLDFESARDTDQLARLQGFELGQLLSVGFQQVGQLEQHGGAGGGAGARPRGEALAGRAHGMLHIGLVGVGDAGDGFAIGRVDHRKGRRRLAGQVLAVNEHAMLSGHECGDRGKKGNVAHAGS
ncbi:hypothetical protein D3C79_829070 [compost metagenome]